jgi:hypothetical protein
MGKERQSVDYTLVRHGMDDWRLGANKQGIEAANVKVLHIP